MVIEIEIEGLLEEQREIPEVVIVILGGEGEGEGSQEGGTAILEGEVVVPVEEEVVVVVLEWVFMVLEVEEEEGEEVEETTEVVWDMIGGEGDGRREGGWEMLHYRSLEG